MTMMIVVDYLLRKTFVLTAFVKVNQKNYTLLKEIDKIVKFF